MPTGAVVLAKALRLDEPFGVGLLLLGCAAGAPFLPKLAELANGNLAFAVGLMVLLMVVTVGYLPIVLPLLLPGVTVDPWQIARSLVLLMLLPLATGLVLKARYGGLGRTEHFSRFFTAEDRASGLPEKILAEARTAGRRQR